MKKIYAKELDNEFFNYEMYYSKDEAESDLFCAYGNRDYADLNNYCDDYKTKLENCKYDLDVIRDDAENYIDLNAELAKIVKYYFKPQEDRANFTDLELGDLITLCDEFYDCRSNEEDDIICAALEICYGFKFKTGVIHGCCQGDWLKYMCPETISQEAIDYIEAVLFAAGTEFMVTDSECENREEAEKAFDNGDCYSVYTSKWRIEDIKADIADQCYGNITKDNIALLTIKERHTYVKYDYEEE